MRIFGLSFFTKNVIHLTKVACSEGLELTTIPPQRQLVQREERQQRSSQLFQCPICHFQIRKLQFEVHFLKKIYLNEPNDYLGREKRLHFKTEMKYINVLKMWCWD